MLVTGWSTGWFTGFRKQVTDDSVQNFLWKSVRLITIMLSVMICFRQRIEYPIHSQSQSDSSSWVVSLWHTHTNRRQIKMSKVIPDDPTSVICTPFSLKLFPASRVVNLIYSQTLSHSDNEIFSSEILCSEFKESHVSEDERQRRKKWVAQSLRWRG